MKDILEAQDNVRKYGHTMINELEDVWLIKGNDMAKYVTINGMVDTIFQVNPRTAWLEGFLTCLSLFEKELAFARGNM